MCSARGIMQVHDEGEKPRSEVACWQSATNYLVKFRGTSEGLFPAYPSVNVLLWSFISSFTGISLCALLTYPPWSPPEFSTANTAPSPSFLIGSFGATAVLIYGTIDSPLSQPRNVIVGQVISAAIGIIISTLFNLGGLAYPTSTWLWLQCGLAVSLSLLAMQVLRVVHPPGGATALIAVTSPPLLRNNGLYIVYPVLTGVTIMLVVALVVNNITRQYPLYWWRPDVRDVPVPEDATEHSAAAFGEAFDTVVLHHRDDAHGPSCDSTLNVESLHTPEIPDGPEAALDIAG